jgi:hypothetical protein
VDVRTSPDRRGGAFLGAALMLAALAANRWSLGWYFFEDGLVAQPSTRRIILGAQLVVGLIGAVLLWRRPALPAAARLGTWLLVAVSAVGLYHSSVAFRVLSKISYQRDLILAINRSEDLLQWLTPKLHDLNTSTLNLTLFDAKAQKLFADEIETVDLAGPGAQPPEVLGRGLATAHHWEVASEHRAVSRAALDLWRPLLDRVDYFEHAKFYFVKGHFTDEAENEYESQMGFAALARLRDGRMAHVTGKLMFLWIDSTALFGDETWLIRKFETKKLDLTEADWSLFAEVLDTALPDPEARERARRSIHEEKIVAVEKDGAEEHRWFSNVSFDRHPGISVVDLDRDGFDDLYLMARWGRNQFFRNRGDGTFEEVAGELGLDLEDHCSAAVFADFDNDGDDDVFVGRTLVPSVYLLNEGGRFVDHSLQLAAPLPSLVASVSAADFDRDGLLDVYFTTYAGRMLGEVSFFDATGEKARALNKGRRYLSTFLSDGQAAELFERFHNGDFYQNRVGPPNTLLRNSGGGRFEIAGGEPMEVWRNSYQATWADYDGDGDPDLYVANDFAPNNLLRNEGDGSFSDVTAEQNAQDIGFGMGAAWGDYDNDGSEDLYVTNMYSKAGLRITAQIAELDPSVGEMAHGNSLLDWNGTRFEKVSSLDASGLMVEKAGWGWGGQFIDFNNDGALDVHALSGYYTAPSQVAIPVDR